VETARKAHNAEDAEYAEERQPLLVMKPGDIEVLPRDQEVLWFFALLRVRRVLRVERSLVRSPPTGILRVERFLLQ